MGKELVDVVCESVDCFFVIGKLLDEAVRKRGSILSEGTNAVRLVDGAGDGVSGFALEEYAGRWLAMTPGGEISGEIKSWLKASGKSVYWKRLDQHQKDSPVHLYGDEVGGAFEIRENGISYEVSFHSGYSQGIFLDQRANRAEVGERAVAGKKVLNLFSYTGGFSVAAALGGAETTTLDLSGVYLNWAKRNFACNELDASDHYFCKGDAFHWMRRFAKQGRRFDGIVIDPPTFSRDEKGKVFRVEKDFGELTRLASGILSDGGWMLCCTNFRRIDLADFTKMISVRGMKCEHRPMTVDFSEESYLKSVWME